MSNHEGSLQITNTVQDLPSASTVSPKSPLKSRNTVFETFLLAWADPNVNSSTDNTNTQKHLRKILTCLKTFDAVPECEKWLKGCSIKEKIILIVSGGYGKEIVPRIHDMSAIIGIYVYCLDVDRNKVWAKNFSKIRLVASATSALLTELSAYLASLENIEDSKALKIYEKTKEYSTSNTESEQLCFQLLLEIFVSHDYLPTKGTLDNFIATILRYTANSEYGLQLIAEFQRTYTPEKAISWLLRDTPLVRFINKALRELDFQVLFALRFLILDIRSQIIKHQASMLNVFKIQLMSRTEMENCRAHPGQCIVVNGFLLATTDPSRLRPPLMNSDHVEIVLFDIKAKFREGVAPFAFIHDIDPNIEIPVGQEVIFMCGSTFEVGPLLYEDSIWRLHLILLGETDLQDLCRMKQQLKETNNPKIIGDILNGTGQKEKAKIYYETLSKELHEHYSQASQNDTKEEESAHKTINSSATKNVSFVVINLTEHMSTFASAILNGLHSLTSNLISVKDNQSSIDFSELSTTASIIFTTTQINSSTKTVPRYCSIFLLDDGNKDMENGDDKKNVQQRFGKIDDLICRLVDEVIRYYRTEANEYAKRQDFIKAKAISRKVNRIYRELSHINEKIKQNQPHLNKSDLMTPILVWLIPNTEQADQDNSIDFEKNFKEYFASCSLYTDENELHFDLATNLNRNDAFLIIHTTYQESIATGISQLSNVKFVYRYGKSKNDSDNDAIDNQQDLLYRLTYDLMDYHTKKAEDYRDNKQLKEAHAMFVHAKNLCHFLSKNFFQCE